MKVKVLIGRTRLPAVGEIFDCEKSEAEILIGKGLIEAVDKKLTKKKPQTEGKTDGKKSEGKGEAKEI